MKLRASEAPPALPTTLTRNEKISWLAARRADEPGGVRDIASTRRHFD
jgi:hypothetical protein